MDVTASVDAARERAQEHLATFARRVGEALEVDAPRGVNKLLASIGARVDELAAAAAGEVGTATAPWTASGEGERLKDRFARDARLTFAPLLAYSKGVLDGGGPAAVDGLAETLAAAWAEPALAAWYDRVIEDFVAAGLGEGPASAPPTPAAAAHDLAALLSRASALGIRIKNVPDNPTPRYLEKLAAQLDERARKTPPPPSGASRLQALLAFAEELKIRVKVVPDSPSETWLQKMEDKLREVAGRKGMAMPPELGGPPRAEPEVLLPDISATPAWAPERHATGGNDTGLMALPTESPETEAERRVRVETLLEKASEAGLELGRIPTAPTDEWVSQTEALLEAAIARRKDERKSERKRKEAERKARIQLLMEKASRLGVDLGPIPPFPTDDWIARAALRIQTAMLGPTEGAGGDSGRLDRLRRLLADADSSGVELGELPPDPDDEWLAWAESLIEQHQSAAEGAIALVSEGFEALSASLVYEEGTVQEQSWAVDPENSVSVGRGRGNTVHVRDDAGISRQHFVIWLDGNRYWLRDEGSTKGTAVNGRRSVEEVELRGDEDIVASETRFVFRVR